jgi:transposase-like protein
LISDLQFDDGKYQRYYLRIFLYGASTRLTGEALRQILGEAISAQTISNIAKSLDDEVRRRTRLMSCFNNTQSIERIVYAVLNRLINKWRTPYLDLYRSLDTTYTT